MLSRIRNLNDCSRQLILLELIILLFCLISALLTFFSVEQKNIYVGDSKGYERISRNLSRHMAMSLESHAEGRPFYSTMARMPGFPALLAVERFFLGNSVWNYTIVNLCAFGLTAMLVTGMAFRVFGFYPALISGLLLVTHVSELYCCMSLQPESTTNLIVISLLFIYWRFRDASGVAILIAIGVLTGLAALFREPVGPVLAIGLMALGTNWRNSPQLIIKRSAIIFVAASLSFSPWVIRNYALSQKFIPVTIFFSGAGTNVKDMQLNGDLGLFLPPDFWEKNFLSEYYMLDKISKDIGYDYYVLSGNLEDRKVEVKKSDLFFDPATFYPVELVTQLKADMQMQPTVKIELIYTEICRRFTESIKKPVPIVRRLKVYLLKSLMLYSLNDMSPYHQWRYGQWFHRFNQVRWYCVEMPLLAIGLVVTLARRKLLPLTSFLFLYTCLVIFNMQVESRYGLLPILLLKVYIGFGAYTVYCWVAGLLRRKGVRG